MKENFFEESQKRIDTIESLDFQSLASQLSGYLKYLESVPDVKDILEKLLANKNVETVINASSNQKPPELKTLEDIASACALLMEIVREKNDATVLFSFGVRGYHGNEFSQIPHEFARRYLRPFHNYLLLVSNQVTIFEEFQIRLTTLLSPQFQEASFRVAGLWEWMTSNQTIQKIIENVNSSSQAEKILADANYNSPPQTESPDDIKAVGFHLMQACSKGANIYNMGFKFGIRPNFHSDNLQDTADAVMEKFIMPALCCIEEQLSSMSVSAHQETNHDGDNSRQSVPNEIVESLITFRMENPGVTAFIMMQFAKTETHRKIVNSIKETLAVKGITGLRADDRQYHDDLFPNVKTYMHGCDFGVAVFERIEDEVFNPNVSLEVGYLLALGKPICYLKDKSLKQLPSDLISKLYREFDTHEIQETLPSSLLQWLHEKGICQATAVKSV